MRVEGAFDVAEYVNFLAPSNPSEMETTLKHDGFVSGFGRSWAQQGTTHLLLEIVVAFRGATGAKSWLAASGAADSSNQYFKGAIVVSGVDPSYGGHFADPATPAYADIVAFVKGNDYFLVGILSGSDDLADSASTQTLKQYEDIGVDEDVFDTTDKSVAEYTFIVSLLPVLVSRLPICSRNLPLLVNFNN